MIDYTGFKNWLKEQEASDSTISSYMDNLKVYENFGGDFTKDNIVDFKWKMLESRKPATINHYLVAISKYCKYKGIVFDVKQVKVQKKSYVQNVMTMDQYKTLISSLEKDGKEREAMYIKIIAQTGARVSEAIRLKKNDFNERYKQFFTKGKVRTIYFPDSLREEIRNYHDEIFINRSGKPITSRGFDFILKQSCKKYGIPKEVAHAHSLRHLFAIEFLKQSNNISLLADVLGHSGVNTTMIYTRMSQEEQLNYINRIVNW